MCCLTRSRNSPPVFGGIKPYEEGIIPSSYIPYRAVMKTIADLTKFLDKVEKELNRYKAHVVKAFTQHTIAERELVGKEDAIAFIDRCYQICRDHYDTVIGHMSRMKSEWERLVQTNPVQNKASSKRSQTDLVAIQVDRFVASWLLSLEQLYLMQRGYLYQYVDRVLLESLPGVREDELEFTRPTKQGYCAVYETRTLPKQGRNLIGQIYRAKKDIKISPRNIAKCGESFFLPANFSHSEFEKPFYYHGDLIEVKAEVIANATQILLAAITSNEGYRDFNSYSKIIQKGMNDAAKRIAEE